MAGGRGIVPRYNPKGRKTMKHYVSITIGRNVGDKPMSSMAWSNFVTDIMNTPHHHGKIDGTIYAGIGQGIWENTWEESHALIILMDSINEPALRHDLAKLAKRYKQDAIGCVIVELPNGDESLVFAK